MGALSDAAKKVFRGGERPHEVAGRIDALEAAVGAARGRLDAEVLDPAAELAARASERLKLSGEHTIVALAGATGSGKSSLFNALTDLELAGVGVRRPTTAWALACAWGPDGAEELLEWMGIPSRHQVSRQGMFDPSPRDQRLDGLVLLDLPDHDSTEIAHHLEMERLVAYADVLVWVLDPQKYADAAIHERYIQPMAAYHDVTLVVLNQLDRIPEPERDRAIGDVERILRSEGLPDVEVIGTSATGGDGIATLKRELAARIRAKRAAKERLAADVTAAAEEIAGVGGTSEVPGIGETDRRALDHALLECAGAPRLVTAIESSTRRQAARRTGWPVTRWLQRLRPDPLARLGLDPDNSIHKMVEATVPTDPNIQRSQAEQAVRELAEKAAVGLERPWREAVRRASTTRGSDIVTALDRAMAEADLRLDRRSWWWGVVNLLQWLAFGALVAGLAWLLAEFAVSATGLQLPDPPVVAGFSLPVLLAVGGALVGIALAASSGVLARISGRRRAARAADAMRVTIGRVSEEKVIAPIETELAAYARYRENILIARG